MELLAGRCLLGNTLFEPPRGQQLSTSRRQSGILKTVPSVYPHSRSLFAQSASILRIGRVRY